MIVQSCFDSEIFRAKREEPATDVQTAAVERARELRSHTGFYHVCLVSGRFQLAPQLFHQMAARFHRDSRTARQSRPYRFFALRRERLPMLKRRFHNSQKCVHHRKTGRRGSWLVVHKRASQRRTALRQEKQSWFQLEAQSHESFQEERAGCRYARKPRH